MTTFFTIQDIDNIIFNGFQYKLPQIILDTIKKIENELKLTEIVEKKDTYEEKGRHKNIKRMDHSNHRNNKNTLLKPLNN